MHISSSSKQAFHQAYDSRMKFCWPVVALLCHSIKRRQVPWLLSRQQHQDGAIIDYSKELPRGINFNSVPRFIFEQEQLSTFQVFETSVLNRIKESQQAHDGDSHSSPLVRQRDANSVVTMSFIQDMLHLSDYERMKQLASIMNENGGYLIVQLNDEEANVLTDMWKCIDNIHFPGTSSSGDDHASLFRRQVLTRNDTDSNSIWISVY